ncbi:MAG: hypothetical protein PVI01_13725 [Gemmatimonadales bacterium]|jgi:6-oxo-cyclohex-1-ene-carbonyl-CoA hydrolase
MLNSHTLVPDVEFKEILYELRPALDPAGQPVEGLHNAWIWLNNPKQFNSYTTDAARRAWIAVLSAWCLRR